MNTVGERLKTLREGMGLSQKKMAELLKSGMQTILMSRWTISPAAVTSRRASCIRHGRRSLTIRNWESLLRCALTRNLP